MKKNSELKKQQQLGYGVYVTRDGGLFTLMVPELGISRRHKDLNEGFKELTAAQEEYFKNRVDSEVGSFRPELLFSRGALPPAKDHGKNVSSLLSFVMKTAVLLLLLCGIGGIGTVVVGNIVIKNFSRVVSMVEVKLKELPDERVEQYAQKIHRFGQKIEPVIFELKQLWRVERKIIKKTGRMDSSAAVP
jgi:hypothetical protein